MRTLKADEIEVKVKQVTAKGCLLLLYKTARVDMQLLDETFGIGNWQCDYKTINGVLYCGIGVFNKDTGSWVWKWDCGIESRGDTVGNEKKGEASDAFKRAGFKWGIGRELYTAPFIWAKVPTVKDTSGKWQLANKYASFTVETIDYDKSGNIINLNIIDEGRNLVFSTKNKTKNDNTANAPVAKPNIKEELAKANTEQELRDIANSLMKVFPKKQITDSFNERLAELQKVQAETKSEVEK